MMYSDINFDEQKYKYKTIDLLTEILAAQHVQAEMLAKIMEPMSEERQKELYDSYFVDVEKLSTEYRSNALALFHSAK